MEPIKRLHELSFEEILKITYNSEAYNRLIDLECAHAGISLLPEDPGPEPDVPKFTPDLVLYKIGNWGFTNIEAAQAVLHAITSNFPCKTKTVKNMNVLKVIDSSDYYWPKIENEPVFSETEYGTIKESAIIAADELSEWKAKKKEYDSVVDERKTIVKTFTQKKDHAYEVISNIAKILSNLDRYLDLAQGSYPIAVGFLKEACKDSSISLEEESVYYCCTNGDKHFVISREEYQNKKMNNLLGATE